MRLDRSVIVLAVFTAAVLAQPRPSAPPSGAPKRPGSVTGIVTNSVTGEPVKKATVTLHSPRFGMAVTEHFAYVAITGADGLFKMSSVEPSRGYSVTVHCPGFTDEYGQSGGAISVDEEQAVTGVALKLSPLGIVSGKVLDEDGEPIPGASVQAMQIFYQEGARQVRQVNGVQTDDRGSYRLYDLRPGRTFVAVTSRDLNLQSQNTRLHSDQAEEAYPTTFYPKATELAGASATSIVPGAEISGVDFHLKKVPVYHVRGKALDAESRQPVHGSSLQLGTCGSGQQYIVSRIVQLQPDGSFDLNRVLPGQQCIRVAFQPGARIFAQQTVNVGGQDLNDVVLSVSSPVELHGTVLFESAPPASLQNLVVQLRPPDNLTNNPNTKVKPDNSFVLPNVFPVPYELQLMPLPPGFYLKSIQYGERDASDGHIDVTSGGAPLTLVLASDSANLSVTVQAADGSPAKGVPVVLAPTGSYTSRRDLFTVRPTTGAGVASFTGVAPGDYKIFAMTEVDYGLVQVAEFLELLESRAGSVSLQTNGSQSVQVQLIPAELVNEAKKKLQ